MKVSDVLKFLNEKAPFETAMSYDNVGLLVGDSNMEITGICCCLDITHGIIEEAADKGANLIISHHPVIFDGLKSLKEWNPAVEMIRKNIAAIAMHTNFDIAPNGVNDTLVELLEFESAGILDITHGNIGYGAICDIGLEYSPKSLAEHCKNKLDLECVRYSRENRSIKRIAVCCGGGVDRDIMRLARENNCDAIISGDIKHNFWIEAENCGMTLIDAGHFGTEKFAANLLAKLLTEPFREVPVFSAEREKDPCGYV